MAPGPERRYTKAIIVPSLLSVLIHLWKMKFGVLSLSKSSLRPKWQWSLNTTWSDVALQPERSLPWRRFGRWSRTIRPSSGPWCKRNNGRQRSFRSAPWWRTTRRRKDRSRCTWVDFSRCTCCLHRCLHLLPEERRRQHEGAIALRGPRVHLIKIVVFYD